MKKKLKGFTLIELLAIIVILAIVLVITIPVITKVVKNANKSAAIESAYGYKDSINKYQATQVLKDKDYKLEDGTYTVSDLKNMGVAVNGKEPSDGWVIIEKNKVTDYSLKFGDYVVNYDNEEEEALAIKDGAVEVTLAMQINNVKAIAKNYIEIALYNNRDLTTETTKDTAQLSFSIANGPSAGWIQFDKTDSGVVIIDYSLQLGEFIVNYNNEAIDNMVAIKNGTLKIKPVTIVETVDGVKYFDSKWINANPIYLDPTDLTKKCDSSNSISTSETKSGCMKWYAYSKNSDGTINMLLDHNTTAKIEWVNESDYAPQTGIPTLATNLGITYPYNKIEGSDTKLIWNKGPITLLKQLKSDTANWSNELIRNDSYIETDNKKSDFGNYYVNYDVYTISYTGYKARLITYNEIAIITKNTWCEKSGSCGWSFSTNTYAWLFSNIINNNYDAEHNGYWTQTPSGKLTDLSPKYALGIYYYTGEDTTGWGNINRIQVNTLQCYGLRPVITVSNSVVFGN